MPTFRRVSNFFENCFKSILPEGDYGVFGWVFMYILTQCVFWICSSVFICTHDPVVEISDAVRSTDSKFVAFFYLIPGLGSFGQVIFSVLTRFEGMASLAPVCPYFYPSWMGMPPWEAGLLSLFIDEFIVFGFFFVTIIIRIFLREEMDMI